MGCNWFKHSSSIAKWCQHCISQNICREAAVAFEGAFPWHAYCWAVCRAKRSSERILVGGIEFRVFFTSFKKPGASISSFVVTTLRNGRARPGSKQHGVCLFRKSAITCGTYAACASVPCEVKPTQMQKPSPNPASTQKQQIVDAAASTALVFACGGESWGRRREKPLAITGKCRWSFPVGNGVTVWHRGA